MSGRDGARRTPVEPDRGRRAGALAPTVGGRTRHTAGRFAVLFHLGVLVWLGYLLYRSLDWAWADRLFPQLVGGVAVVLTVGVLFRIVWSRYLGARRAASRSERGRHQHETTGSEGSIRVDRRMVTHATVVFLSCAVFPVVMYLFGFVVTIPLFLFLFDYSVHRNPVRSLVFAIGYIVVLYVFFVVLLGAHFWEGAVGFTL